MHTSGPWKAVHDVIGGDEGQHAIVSVPGQRVAVVDLADYRVYGAGHNGDAAQRVKDAEAGANAWLIAAAPKMLAALQKADKALTFTVENCQLSPAAHAQLSVDRAYVRAAINEATKEG